MKIIFNDGKGITAGFSTLHDGNTSFKWSGKNPLKNRISFLAQLGLSVKDLVMSEQTHGCNITVVNQQDKGKGATQKDWVSRDDGLITQNKGLILGIETADCLPILAYDSMVGVIAAVHAGWRGVVTGITQRMVEKFFQFGSRAQDINVWVGPHIQKCCFLVKSDIISKFKAYNDLITQTEKGYFVDLKKIIEMQITSLGVIASKIKFDDDCTCCEKNYYSWRRDGKKCKGSMLTVISQK